MTATDVRWPYNGLEAFFDFTADFRHLNINLGSPTECKSYHDNWMQKYGAAMKTWSEYETVSWVIRCRQSLKLCFSATLFCLYADTQTGFKPSRHYFTYYSMFHAMWAVLYLHPKETITTITEMTHSKMANVFNSDFSSGKRPIISYDAKELASDFRFLREYYSYRMPLNSPFKDYPELSSSHASLGGFVKQCIQLANLHSHMICKAANKHGKTGADVPPARIAEFLDQFRRVNGKEHVDRKVWAIDSADLRTSAEFVHRGVDLIPHSLAYDHMFDDFMTWEDDMPDADLLERVRTLVGNALA